MGGFTLDPGYKIQNEWYIYCHGKFYIHKVDKLRVNNLLNKEHYLSSWHPYFICLFPELNLVYSTQINKGYTADYLVFVWDNHIKHLKQNLAKRKEVWKHQVLAESFFQ